MLKLKKRIIALVTGLTLSAFVLVGSFGIVADSLGLEVTSQAHACECAGSGGGC